MKVLFQGDSITDAGRCINNGSLMSIGQGYALIAASKLCKESPSQYEFFNRGISGNRIVDLYQRIKVDFWNLEPDVCSILLGVNDVWHEAMFNNGVEAERFENVYRMLISDTVKVLPNISFMLIEPFALKTGAAAESWDFFETEIKKRQEIVKKLSEEFGTELVLLQDKFNEAANSSAPEYWLGDGVHPTIAGHRLIAEEWLKSFKRLCKCKCYIQGYTKS